MDQLAALLPPLRPLSGLSDGFDELIAQCAGVAIGKRSAAEVVRGSRLPAETTEALVALFLEVARVGTPADELTTALSSVLPAERASAIATLAADGQPTLRTTLESLSLGPEQLVDVSWTRATVAAAGLEQPRPGGTPVYTVTLTLRRPDGAARPLQFAASIEELHDLVATLKSAMRAVERETGKGDK